MVKAAVIAPFERDSQHMRRIDEQSGMAHALRSRSVDCQSRLQIVPQIPALSNLASERMPWMRFENLVLTLTYRIVGRLDHHPAIRLNTCAPPAHSRQNDMFALSC